MRYIVIAVVVDGRKRVAGSSLGKRRADIVGATPTATAAMSDWRVAKGNDTPAALRQSNFF